VPVVGFGRMTGESGFEFGEVIDEVICDSPHCLVRCVDPRRLTVDGDINRAARPQDPCGGQLQDVLHHAGDNVCGLPIVYERSLVGHEFDPARRIRHATDSDLRRVCCALSCWCRGIVSWTANPGILIRAIGMIGRCLYRQPVVVPRQHDQGSMRT
jgi:hypothetical protein